MHISRDRHLTTQGVKEASNLVDIRREMKRIGCEVPISADVHFNPNAAYKAAETADKVRINPGNFVDAARTFRKLEFTDEEYAGEIDRIRQSFLPFLDLCRQHHTAVRLGVNHGSLSDRIMSRYGDTPAGMVESVMEYLRIAREVDFRDIVISIKASNTVVMVETVRLLVAEMDREGMHFPLHLGVTEAGDAEDGRIKSAVGIGALLHEGIGDTIRVSLSEPPENEVPVAIELRDYVCRRAEAPHVETPSGVLPGASRDYADKSLPLREFSIVDARMLGALAAEIDRYVADGGKNPVLMTIAYDCDDLDRLRIRAGADFGIDGVSGATPLAALKAGESPDVLTLFLGLHGGCIGEVSALAILAGGIYLIAKRVISVRIPLTYILSTAVFIAIITAVTGGDLTVNYILGE